MAAITNNRAVLYLACAAAALLILLGLGTRHPAAHEQIKAAISSVNPFKGYQGHHQDGALSAHPSPSSAKTKTWTEIATQFGTDKVGLDYGQDTQNGHGYQQMYDKYLPQFRDRKVKLLEIGLGCTMNYGPGASYFTWLEYFDEVDLYFIEYDAECAAKWAGDMKGATIVPGDQSDGAFLESFLQQYGGDFDIIVDDGGHTPKQQLVSLQHLWKAVKPGGVYFLEDLEFNYMDDWEGGNTAAALGYETTTQVILRMIEDLMTGFWIPQRRVNFAGVETMVQIDCMQSMCAFWQQDEGEFMRTIGH